MPGIIKKQSYIDKETWDEMVEELNLQFEAGILDIGQ